MVSALRGIVVDAHDREDLVCAEQATAVACERLRSGVRQKGAQPTNVALDTGRPSAAQEGLGDKVEAKVPRADRHRPNQPLGQTLKRTRQPRVGSGNFISSEGLVTQKEFVAAVSAEGNLDMLAGKP